MSSAALLGVVTASPASAAEESAPVLEEVVVSASKVQERIQDVAAPITAVSQARLQDIQADRFEDYAKLIPGLSLNENKPGQMVLTLQGISSFSAGSTVAVYVDDTPYGSSSGLTNAQFYSGDLSTYDVQRVEVLKGPQGTLYGASTLGGLLKFVSNAPDPSHFAAEVQTGSEETAGSWGWSAKGMVNLPLSDTAAFRVSGVHEADPGYIDDPSRGLKNINSSHENGVHASFLIKPLEQLSVRLTAVGQDSDFNDINAEDLKEDATGAVLTPVQPLTGDRQLSQNVSQYTHSRYRVYDLAINWDMGFASLVSATSYGTLRQAALTDVSILGPEPPVVEWTNFKLDRLTQEVRLQSTAVAHPAANQVDWLFGGYFDRETAAINVPISGTLGGAFPLDGSQTTLASTYKEGAVFATVTYYFLPQFDVALGGRYAHNKQTSDQTFSGPYYDILLGGMPEEIGGSSQGVALYSIAPRWRPSEDLTVYARVASGYRPGGPNVFALGSPPAGISSSFKSDTVVSADLGARAEMLNHSLSIDVSAFDIHWHDIQLIGLVPVSEGGTTEVSFTQNGGTAESRGFEWQGAWLPLTGLTLALNGAFTDAKLTADTTPQVGGFKGNPLPYVPRWTSALDIAYEHPVTANFTAYAGALTSYVGRQSTAFSPTFSPQYAQFALASYTTLDVRLGVKGARWNAELFCKNATDRRGVTGIVANQSANGLAVQPGGFGQSAFIIRPRTAGLNLTMRF
jgi:outer membrane receptor protein involved in Fe transport